MPRNKARPEPIDGELVIVPSSPSDPIPPDMPSFDAPPAPDDDDKPLSMDAAPDGGWSRLGVGLQVNTETMRELQEAFPPSRVVAVMEQLATATLESKSGKLRPDYRAREQFVKIMLSYNLGLPVPQQPPPAQPAKETDAEGLARILTSAAARRMLAAEIERAEEVAALLAAEAEK